jgi:hypothetical protein
MVDGKKEERPSHGKFRGDVIVGRKLMNHEKRGDLVCLELLGMAFADPLSPSAAGIRFVQMARQEMAELMGDNKLFGR